MLRRCLSALFVLGLLIVVRPLAAAEGATALDAITSEASVVVRLKTPKASIDRLADFVDTVQPPFGQNVRQFGRGIGAAIENPMLGGVDMTKDWYLAAFAPMGEGAPVVVYIIPATDLKAMKKALGDDIAFVEHGSWGVYSTNADAIEKATARIKGEGKSIATVIDKESAAAMDRGELAVFVNVAQLVAANPDQIAQMKSQAEKAIEDIPDEATPGSPLDPKAITEIATKLLKGIVQGLEDTNSFVIAMGVSKQGMAIEELIRVTAESETDKFLASSGPSPMTVLNSLPAGKQGYFGLKGDVASFTKLMGSFIASAGGDEDKAKEVQGLLDELSKLKFGTIAAEFSLSGGKDGALQAASVTEVDDPMKVRELSKKSIKMQEGAKTPGIKQEYDYKPDAEKYGKNSADVVKVKTEAEDADSPEGQMAMRFINLLFGPEGMTTRSVYLKDRVVQTIGGGKEEMGKLLEGLAQPPASKGTEPKKKNAGTGTSAEPEEKSASNGREAFLKVRGQLSEKANLIVLLDLPGLIVGGARIAVDSGSLPIPLDAAALDDLQLKDSYIGFSIGTEPQGLRCRTVISVEQLQGIARLVMLGITLSQQQPGAQPEAPEEPKTPEKKPEKTKEKKEDAKPEKTPAKKGEKTDAPKKADSKDKAKE